MPKFKIMRTMPSITLDGMMTISPGIDVQFILTSTQVSLARSNARGTFMYIYTSGRCGFICVRGNVVRQSKSRTCHMSVRRNLATHQRHYWLSISCLRQPHEDDVQTLATLRRICISTQTADSPSFFSFHLYKSLFTESIINKGETRKSANANEQIYYFHSTKNPFQ